MLFYKGKQLIEGIDSIDLSFQPYLMIDFSKQLDPKNGISIYSNEAKIPNIDGGIYRKFYNYLHISGEYINPELPIKESIANAIKQMLTKNILHITDYSNGESYSEMSYESISDNIDLFISGIKIIEFCFDFDSKKINIANDAKIIDTGSAEFYKFLGKPLRDRERCLIKIDTTYYSYDLNKNRKSTLKIYDRGIWLPKKGNEYPLKLINENQYKMRIEFVLKRHLNTQYLTLNNLDGNYEQIVRRFTPYLAHLYKKYFLGLVKVNDFDHPYFYNIYDLAHSDIIRRNNILENYNKTKKINDKYEISNNYFKLLNLMKKEYKRKEKLLLDLPNCYYAWLGNITEMKKHCITPYDYSNNDKIRYISDDFVFFHNQLITLDLKYFKIIDEN